MIVDLSKIPSTCTWHLHVSVGGGFRCNLSEVVRGRTISAAATGETPQEAVDKAIEEFTR